MPVQGGDQQPGAGGHVQTWERKALGKMGERKRGFSFLILPQGGLCSAETQDLKGSQAQGGAGVRLRAGRWSEMQVGVLPAEREGWDCVCSEAGPEPRAPPSPQVQTQLSPFLCPTPALGSSLFTHHQLCPLPPAAMSRFQWATCPDPDHLFSPEAQRSGHSSHHVLQFILSMSDSLFP